MTNGTELPIDDSSKHIVCFVALPFADTEKFPYNTVLMPALRKVLERYPYFWQVGRADDSTFAETIYDNVAAWMQRAHAYIADISDLNPNVMMEFGYMYWARKPGQPLVVLEREDTEQHLSDLAGFIRIPYPDVNGRGDEYDIARIADGLEKEFDKRPRIQSLNASAPHHYLSPLLFRNYVDNETAKAIAKAYTTIEAFVADEDLNRLRYRNIHFPKVPLHALQVEFSNMLKAL